MRLRKRQIHMPKRQIHMSKQQEYCIFAVLTYGFDVFTVFHPIKHAKTAKQSVETANMILLLFLQIILLFLLLLA